jgi:putative hemolysin
MRVLAGAAQYTLRIAADAAEVRAAQRLRYQVFAGELGATLHATEPGLDEDEFDRYCDHLVVIDHNSASTPLAGAPDRMTVDEDATGAVVGTYRMLPPGRAARRYSDGEFDLSAHEGIAGDLVETGRSCVHPDHRDGAVINLIWAGIARYMHLTGHRWLGGCASVDLADGGATVAGVWDLARRKHLAPEGYRVTPHHPWPVPTGPAARVAVPPLLRGYLRLGAYVCGPPAHDPDFGCADFYVLLDVAAVDPRYMRHFLGEAA